MAPRRDGRPAIGLCQAVRLLCLGWLLPAVAGKTLRYYTYEEEPPGTVIGTLAEELPLKPTEGERSFRLLQQPGNSSAVRVRERDGQLSVGAERLDREALCGPAEEPCVLPFDVVSLGGGRGGAQYRLLHVELEVRDINDHAPRFPQPVLALEVSESAAPGTRLPLELARDPDAGSNGVQSFALSPADGPFGLEAQSRADGRKGAELVLLRELDREAQAAYRLELVAKDGGRPARSGTATLSVRVLDANDNAPAFPRGALLTLELPEDAPPGALLLELDAADPDEGANGQLLYSWGSQVPPEARRLFALDPLSGRLSLRAALDYELQRAYELDVQASDRGASPLAASCKVLVRLLDVNDNAPALAVSALSAGPGSPAAGAEAGLAFVSEAAAPQSLVALVSASDGDAGANGQVRLALLPAPQQPFALQRAYEASYLLLTAAPLDRERVPEYNLTLVAEDLGSPPARTVRRLTVRLADENDNAPRFAEARYELALLENNAPGAYLAALLASDPDLGANGRLSYRLLDGPAPAADASLATYLSLDPATGALYAARAFDYELLKQLEVSVQAVDGGSPPLSGTAVVRVRVVDQNDNAPLITHPRGTCPCPWAPPPGSRSPAWWQAMQTRAPMPSCPSPSGCPSPSPSTCGPASSSFGSGSPPVLHPKRRSVEDSGRPALTSAAALRLIPAGALPSSVEILVLQPAEAREGTLVPPSCSSACWRGLQRAAGGHPPGGALHLPEQERTPGMVGVPGRETGIRHRKSTL